MKEAAVIFLSLCSISFKKLVLKGVLFVDKGVDLVETFVDMVDSKFIAFSFFTESLCLQKRLKRVTGCW